MTVVCMRRGESKMGVGIRELGSGSSLTKLRTLRADPT